MVGMTNEPTAQPPAPSAEDIRSADINETIAGLQREVQSWKMRAVHLGAEINRLTRENAQLAEAVLASEEGAEEPDGE
jgi:hypothetical protein